MTRPLKYWIKERYNIQTGIYYVACGQLTQKDAKAKEKALYGSNIMLSFDSSELYHARLEELRKEGKLRG